MTTKPLENLKGLLKTNDKKWGTATHAGAIKIRNNFHYIFGWFEQKEVIDEYGKKENIKYFKLWTTQSREISPSIDKLKTDGNNTGLLATNTERSKGSHPHYKGEIKINGKLYYLACWRNAKKQLVNGEIVISNIFALTASEPRYNDYECSNNYDEDYYSKQEPVAVTPAYSLDDDVPF